MKTNQLHITGWVNVHTELARLGELHRQGQLKPVNAKIKFGNGGSIAGIILFSQSDEEYLVLQTESGPVPFARYKAQEMWHDSTERHSMTPEVLATTA